LSRASAQHRKPSPFSSARPSASARHRKRSPIASALQHKPARIAATLAGSALIVSAGWQATAHWPGETPSPARTDKADALQAAGAGAQLGAGPSTAGFSQLPDIPHAGSQRVLASQAKRTAARHPARRHKQHRSHPRAVAVPGYGNPFRSVSGLIPERVDMGADFGGTGPVYALGDAVITNATSGSGGWPGGGWITYRLTDGPGSGLVVYVAEDVTPTVQVGQQVSSSTVIANMFAGGDGIETGWAQPDGASAESQLPVAGGISGGGPFPTVIGANFEELLQSVGVPAGNNSGQTAYGQLPANYPASWK
jgi:hypothetical protein